MNIYNIVYKELLKIFKSLREEMKFSVSLETQIILVEPPRNPAHGDVATNAAMVLSQSAGIPPRALAERLAKIILEHSSMIESADVAGPGFINICLKAQVWEDLIRNILFSGISYGQSDFGQGEKVNVEYVSANPTGPLHVGHARGAVVGDALAGLLSKVGYNVCKEYYINDAGGQIDTLVQSVFLRYREACGEKIDAIPEGLYPGNYLIPVGEGLREKYGKSLLSRPQEEWRDDVRFFSVQAMMKIIREDLEALGVEHDVFSSERELVDGGRVEESLQALQQKGHVYVGCLPPPKGKKSENWEEKPQTLFRSSDFGDDVDRVLKKFDGSWSYFAPDVAYHFDKYQRGFAHMINIFGADHGGYVKRMESAVAALSDGEASLTIKLCQMVRFLDQGEAVRMSKRAGNFVLLRDLVEAVGKDVVRFFMLTRKSDAPLDFDLDAVKERSRDNMVFYVHYAHARCCSVFRMAEQMGINEDIFEETKEGSALFHANMALCLKSDEEKALIRQLAGWPRLLIAAAEAEEPHRIAYYLYELASAFHTLWTKGKEDTTLRFIQTNDMESTYARLALVKAVRLVFASGLAIFNVEPAEELV